MKINTHTDTTHTLRTSGAGGAHIGMFGRTSILMGPEDGGGSGASGSGTGAGGAGSGSGEPATPPAGGAQPRTFTQEEVNRLTGQARAEGRQAAERDRDQQREQPRETPSRKSKAVDGESVESLRAKLDQMDLRNAFDKRAAKFDLSEALESRLFKLYAADKPSDAAAWWADAVKDLGLKSIGTSNNATNNTQTKIVDPAAPQGGPSTSDKGGAAAPSGSDPEAVLRERKPNEWSRSDVQRIYEKHGEEKGNDVIAAAARVHLKTMKVIADPRRPH